jgi:hypothetical protein
VAEGLFCVASRVSAQSTQDRYRADDGSVRHLSVAGQEPALWLGRVLLEAVAGLVRQAGAGDAEIRQRTPRRFGSHAAHRPRNLLVGDEGTANVFRETRMRKLTGVDLES